MNEDVALVMGSQTVLSVVIQLPPYGWRMPLGTVRLRTGCLIPALRYESTFSVAETDRSKTRRASSTRDRRPSFGKMR